MASTPSSTGTRPPKPDRTITAIRPDMSTQPQFSQPVRQIVLMLTVLALVMVAGWIAYGRVLSIFMANVWLNGLILATFALGVLACFWQVGQLIRSVSWIERFAKHHLAARERGVSPRRDQDDTAPSLLAPLAALLGAHGPVSGSISTSSASSILDSVGQRIEENRDITRYLSNLLIFLGLLGTFYGLAITIPAIVDTIRSLAPQEGETGIQVFEKLMGGLESQLGGMATAFSSSLLGLAGSLVVGLLELFVTHGQNRFYRELEEWMSGFTSVSLADAQDGSLDHVAMARFLEQTAAQMVRLQQFHAERDAARDDAAALADERIITMAAALEALVNRAEAEQEAALARIATLNSALNKLVEGQEKMVYFAQQPVAEIDTAAIEAAIDRMNADLGRGRDQMINDLRADILVLTRAVRAARFNDPFRDDLLPEPNRRGS